MPLFGLFKKRSSSNTPPHIFDENKLSMLLKDHDQKVSQSVETPITSNYALTPVNHNSNSNDFDIEYLETFPYTPTTPTINHSNSRSISHSDPYNDIFRQHNETLLKHGYQQIKVIRNLSQGELIEIRSIKNPFEPMVVKKINKNLYWNKITKSDEYDCHNMVEKNIIKEALLLHHCTVANKPPSPSICQYIDFFYDSKYYYLVTEYAGDTNLANWCNKAFEYINKGKLDLEHYKQMVKYIFWQISALMYWLHYDMNICHLAITMEQILVQNGDFIENENGEMRINNVIVIKLCDFSLAEIFKSDNVSGTIGKMAMKTFECNKHCEATHSQHSAPKLFELSSYNAQKADMWCCGMLLFRLTFNKYPFMFQNPNYDVGFKAIHNDVLDVFFEVNNLNKYTFNYLNVLISGLLNCNENKRFDASQIIQCEYFQSYWERYGERITKKSLAQRERLHYESQQKIMRDFPYYSK